MTNLQTITTEQALARVIKGLSKKINKKALSEVIENRTYNDSLNQLLYKYYKRAHYIKNDTLIDFIYSEDFENDNDFKNYLKENFNTRFYTKKYDYRSSKLDKIAMRNTGLIGVHSNGFIVWTTWYFDMYAYLETNNILLTD